MPAVKKGAAPELVGAPRPGLGEESERGPYLMAGHDTVLLPEWPGEVPKSWIHVLDDVVLKAVVADGKPKKMLVLLGFAVDQLNRIMPHVREHYIQKMADGGFNVWAYDHVTGESRGVHFRSMSDLATHPRSVIGMALFMGPRSKLYYVPGETPAELPAPGRKQEEVPAWLQEWRTAADARIRAAEERRARQAQELARRVQASEEEANEPRKRRSNPQYYQFAPQVPGRVVELRARRFNAHYGQVFLARVLNNELGNYAVWSDISNTMGGSGEFERRYGYPAMYDLKYYEHYPAALQDYLTRRTQRRPVPLGGR